jgi:hypothetical protein
VLPGSKEMKKLKEQGVDTAVDNPTSDISGLMSVIQFFTTQMQDQKAVTFKYKLTGDIFEDVRDVVDKFEKDVIQYRWSDSQIVINFSTILYGTAKMWYDRLPLEEKASWPKLSFGEVFKY